MKKSGFMLLFSPKVVVFHHVNPTGPVRHARNLGRDQAYFLMKDIINGKIGDTIRLFLNAMFFNTYWIYEAVRKGDPRALNGIRGFVDGVQVYYRTHQDR
jgi:hypothetical protein